MDTFYVAVVGIALVVLILILTIIGIMMNDKTSNVAVYPPLQSTCPDYWTVDTNGNCIVSSVNIGNVSADKLKLTKRNGGILPNNYSSTIDSTGAINFNDPGFASSYKLSQTCALRQWSLNNNIEWDGISNYNGC